MKTVSNSPSTSTSADASAASTSPRRTLPRTSTFRSRSSCILGASEACASSIDSRGGSSCQMTGNDERSRAAIAAGSPTTIATASPRNRTALSANTGWSAVAGITPNRLRPSMSAAVSTASTPGVASAKAARSPRVKLARW